MEKPTKSIFNYNIVILVLVLSSAFLTSCSKDSELFDEVIEESIEDSNDEEMVEDQSNDDTTNQDNNDENGSDENQSDCQDSANFVFQEEDGILTAEFESGNFSGAWEEMNTEPNFSGTGYMVWTEDQHLNRTGNGFTTFSINIQNPGTYRFVWNSAVTIGDNGTDHNDSWLRFNDADDFYGRQGEGRVYPNDSGKTPNPNGSSSDGWFKIYRSGSNLGFKWQASTSDNDPHDIYVEFNAAGTYTMEVSARSTGHAIDKFVLFDESKHSLSEATTENTVLSAINCN